MDNKIVKNILKRHHDNLKELLVLTKKSKTYDKDVDDDKKSKLKLNEKGKLKFQIVKNNNVDLESSFGWYYSPPEYNKKVQKDEKELETSFPEKTEPDEIPCEENTEIRHMNVKYAAELFRETSKLNHHKFVDCRYPYEYNAGHIRGATSLYTPYQAISSILHSGDDGFWYNGEAVTNKRPEETNTCENFGHDLVDYKLNTTTAQRSPYDLILEAVEGVLNDKELRSSSKSMSLIFYCEFSSVRAPAIANCVRNLDRLANLNRYPSLFVPNIWVLSGGYNEFHSSYEEFCEPNGYVTMIFRTPRDASDDPFKEDIKRKECAKYDKEVRLQHSMWSKVYTSKFHDKV